MSIRHMEDLRKIRPVMAFIVEHHAEVFKDLKPLPQPSKVGMGGTSSHNINLINHAAGQGLGAQGQGLVAMGGLDGGGQAQMGLGARGSTLPSNLTAGSNNALEDAAGQFIRLYTPYPTTSACYCSFLLAHPMNILQLPTNAALNEHTLIITPYPIHQQLITNLIHTLFYDYLTL